MKKFLLALVAIIVLSACTLSPEKSLKPKEVDTGTSNVFTLETDEVERGAFVEIAGTSEMYKWYVDFDECEDKDEWTAEFMLISGEEKKQFNCKEFRKFMFELNEPPICQTTLEYIPEKGFILKNYNWESFPPTPALQFIKSLSTTSIYLEAKWELDNNEIVKEEKLRQQQAQEAQRRAEVEA